MKTGYKTSRAPDRGQSEPLTDIYERVTARILEQLEKGVAPWQSACSGGGGMPKNFVSKNAYQGVNVFLLASGGFRSQWWMTFKQALDCGGNVRKGEKGSLVIKAGTFIKDKAAAAAEAATGEMSSRDNVGRFLKGYTVFNASQIDGIEFPDETPAADARPPCEAAAAIVAAMPNPPEIEERDNNRACYSQSLDRVQMPSRKYYKSEESFHKVLFHELTHATGHASRLERESLIKNRGMNGGGDDGRQIYSQEELVAEMGAAYLAAQAGIVTDDHENSAAYLAGWLTVLKLKENKRWIMQAASQAQKAAHYILGTVRETAAPEPVKAVIVPAAEYAAETCDEPFALI